MPARKAVIAAALLVLLALPFVPRVLRACGPYFALEVLSSREAAVLEPPPAMSMTDGLVPKPGEKLPVEEGDNEEARTRVELFNLSPEHQERVKAMRALSDGDAAYAAGEGLTPVVRDYTAGAVSYHHRQLDKAREYFTRVLTSAPADPAPGTRVVWARYMLGAIARLQGDDEGASAHWAATRGLVRSGYTDPLGLAVASLGEEARLWLKPGTLAKAVALYARQASHGSDRGRASLLMIAEQALGDPALLDEGLRDVTTRRVILRYLYTGKLSDDDPGPPPIETKTPLSATDPFKRVLDAFEKQRVSQVEGADLLAAHAYTNGRFALAAQFAKYETTPLSAWITGKLALRRGDRQAALRSFADAVKGLPARQDERRRAMAETGVLRLSSGDYAQAMELFHSAVVGGPNNEYVGPDYWTDLAYLAERVLTLDELLPLVDRLEPPLSQAERDAIRQVSASPEGQWREESAGEQLRELAARRLMRAGRHEEALRYFDADEKLHGIAKNYIDALTTAHGRWQGAGTRAEAWFNAAKIARTNGMDLLGFELAPDYAVHDGNYEYFPPKPDDLVASVNKGPAAATPDERQRVAASKPAIDSRFHYRLTAVDHALASADALPHRSQAYAAVLCRATSWIIDREPKRAAEVYARYVKEGPYVSWAAEFGRECPEPDFAGAERRRWDERVAMVTWIYTRHPRRTTAGAALLAVAAIAWFALRITRNSKLLRRVA
jgi:tetratricopeptide (TPR) repeat protein